MNQSYFFEKIYRIINKYNAKTKKPRQYGAHRILLYSSEVHMIEVIGIAGELTTTQIAGQMAITKGAVSQTTAKLLKKGLIQKNHIIDTSNTSLISLTEQGREVFKEHRKFHGEMLDKINSILYTSSDETKKKLDEILNIIDNELDNY